MKNTEENLKDEEILVLSIERPSFFEVLVGKYQDAFLRAAFKIVRHREDSEDVVQEAFVKIYLNAKKFKKVEGASFKSWAYRIVINTALTHYNKTKRSGDTAEYVEGNYYNLLHSAGPRGLLDSLEEDFDLKSAVDDVLKKTPEHLRSTVRKYYLEDKSQKEIAEEEGTTSVAVKMKLFRAKKFLKKAAKETKLLYV